MAEEGIPARKNSFALSAGAGVLRPCEAFQFLALFDQVVGQEVVLSAQGLGIPLQPGDSVCLVLDLGLEVLDLATKILNLSFPGLDLVTKVLDLGIRVPGRILHLLPCQISPKGGPFFPILSTLILRKTDSPT